MESTCNSRNENLTNVAILLRQRSRVQKQLNKMLVYYLPTHPEVIEAQGEIDGLRGLIQTELQATLTQKTTVLIQLEEEEGIRCRDDSHQRRDEEHR